jgi:HlyD family secretion protein
MHGIVTTVIDVPSSQHGIENLLENDLLTRNVIEQVGAAPIAVEVELVPHPNTPSGYLWTTRDGPPMVLSGGTPCEVAIAVRAQRPIERLLPMLKQFFVR